MHKVKCYYCGVTFDRDKEPYIAVEGTRRYAHKACGLNSVPPERQQQIELEEYVKKMFKIDYVHPNIQKQIKEYISVNGFSYSGILKTLIYYFEILGNKNDKFLSNPTIGIVPYVYPQAREYYLKIQQAQMTNAAKKISKPDEVVVRIISPEREPMQPKRKFFTFLDEEN